MSIIEMLQQEDIVKWLGIISSILSIISFISGFLTGKIIEKRNTSKKNTTLIFSNGNNIKQEK